MLFKHKQLIQATKLLELRLQLCRKSNIFFFNELFSDEFKVGHYFFFLQMLNEEKSMTEYINKTTAGKYIKQCR